MSKLIKKFARVSEYPGEKTKEFHSREETSCARIDTPWSYFRIPPIIERGEGALLYDVDGNTYTDFASGYSAANLGHCHPKMVEAVKSAATKLDQLHNMLTPQKIMLGEKLVKLAPVDDARCLFDVGGAQAVESTMRLIRLHTKRPNFMAFFGSFHGRATLGALSLTAGYHYRKFCEPTAAKVFFAPYGYCYRCYFDQEYGRCGFECVKFIKKLFETSHYTIYDPSTGESDIGAVFVEPAQGASGYIWPPKEFIQGIREICNKYGLIMVDDDIQMGLGRSGKMFGVEHHGVRPDIILIAKSLAGGYWPLSAIIAKKKITDSAKPGNFGATFAASAFGLLCGLAGLEIIEGEDLCGQSMKKGEYLLKRLKELQEKHKLIGYVDGKGLAIGIELVKNRETKEPATAERKDIQNEALRRGLILHGGGYFGNRFSIIPPLIISQEQMDEAVTLLDESIKAVERKG